MEAPDEGAQPGQNAVAFGDQVSIETITEDDVEHSTSQVVAYSEIYSEYAEREMWHKRNLETVQMIARDEVNEAMADVLKGIRTTTNETEADYQRKCEAFPERLIQFYTTKKNTVPVSPLREGRDKPIRDVFVQPKLSHVTIEKDGSRTKTENVVHQYKDLLYKDGKLNSRVFIQGNPGMGKTIFLTELALDWCDAVSVQNPDHNAIFSDVDTLKEVQFLFQISLRDATEQREVIEMIKTQIVHEIYTDAKREETVKLLPQIMERETCLVTIDGLNEWVDRLNKCVIPLLAQCYPKCISVITSRPWKMADERIKDSQINSLIEIEGVIDSEELSKKIISSLQTGYEKTHTEFMKYVNERQLSHFLSSPWRLTLSVNVWMNYNVSGSLCELQCILIDVLFKNANAIKGYFQKGSSFQCLSNTRFIQQQIDIFDKLAKAAFNLTFSSNKSLVFTERELLNCMSDVQLEFCLRAGVLTKRYSSSKVDQDAQFSFLHETVQDFLAAYHIANSNQDLIANIKIESKYNVLEMSETIIYLCGLACKKANQLLNDINHGLSKYVTGTLNNKYFRAIHTFKETFTKSNVLRLNNNQIDDNVRCLELSVLFQRMIIAGYKEAKASGENDICLTCTNFNFYAHLNESDSNVLKILLLSNKSDVRSLILESNVLHIDVSSFSCVFPTLSQLAFLLIEDSSFSKNIILPDTIKYITLLKCTCTAVFLRQLLMRLSSLKHDVHLHLLCLNVTDCKTQLVQPELSSIDMKHIAMYVLDGNSDLYNLVRCISIGILYLGSTACVSLASEILHTLYKLKHLFLVGTYTGRCDLKLPASLEFICLYKVECSSEWLFSVLITISSLGHPAMLKLGNVVLQSSKETHSGEPQTHVSDLRSKILSRDMSNIMISMKYVSKELFDILWDTSIGIIELEMADCVSLASEIVFTLSKLTHLILSGTYTGRCFAACFTDVFLSEESGMFI